MGNIEKHLVKQIREAKEKKFRDKERAKEEKLKARFEARKEKAENAARDQLANIINNLEESERLAFSSAFTKLTDDEDALFVAAANPKLRQFILTHTAVSPDSLRSVLRRSSCSSSSDIGFDEFLSLMRENAVSDDAAITSFMEVCRGMEAVPQVECRTHLVHLAAQQIKMTITKDKWDVMLDSVFKGADSMIMLDQWIQHSQKLARMARLLQYLEFDLSSDTQGEPATEQQSNHHSLVPAFPEKAGGATTADEEEDELLRALEESRQESERQTAPLAAALQKAPVQAKDLPPVALKCDLCKASGGVCVYHIGAKQNDFEWSSNSSTSAGSSASSGSSSSSSASSSGSGSSGSSSSSSSGSSGSSSSGSNGGIGCDGEQGPDSVLSQCDLCKVNNGRCFYHASLKRIPRRVRLHEGQRWESTGKHEKCESSGVESSSFFGSEPLDEPKVEIREMFDHVDEGGSTAIDVKEEVSNSTDLLTNNMIVDMDSTKIGSENPKGAKKPSGLLEDDASNSGALPNRGGDLSTAKAAAVAPRRPKKKAQAVAEKQRKDAARNELSEAAMAEDIDRLEAAIAAAGEAGLDDDEILPAFEILELITS